MDRVTKAEKRFMAEVLVGSKAPKERQLGGALMPEAARYSLGEEDILEEEAIERVRCAMSGRPTNLPSTPVRGSAKAWWRVQVRQLFRLALESLLYWIILEIGKGPKPTEVLVTDFLGQCAALPERRTAAEWLEPSSAASTGPAEFMARIEDSLDDPAYKDLASGIATGLAFCIAEAPEQPEAFERADRFPLARARREAKAWSQASARDFVRHVLESWVLAQHVYWSVGRGLADARARGKTILRLRVALDDGGWKLTSASARVSTPVPTPDRLEIALSLAKECDLLAAWMRARVAKVGLFRATSRASSFAASSVAARVRISSAGDRVSSHARARRIWL